MEWHHGFFPFCWIIFPILIGFLIFRLFAFRRYGWGCGWDNPRADIEFTLRRRLASGEITEDEYHKLKETLKK